VYKTDYTTVAAIVAAYGEPKVVAWLNAFFGNQNYRKGYNKARNEAFAKVKSDPRFANLLKEVKQDARKAGK
jgi:hypothetical protein